MILFRPTLKLWFLHSKKIISHIVWKLFLNKTICVTLWFWLKIVLCFKLRYLLLHLKNKFKRYSKFKQMYLFTCFRRDCALSPQLNQHGILFAIKIRRKHQFSKRIYIIRKRFSRTRTDLIAELMVVPSVRLSD